MKSRDMKMGGNRTISVFLRGNEDLTDSLLAIGEGGRKMAKGLRQRVEEAYPGQFEIDFFHEPSGPIEQLLATSPPSTPSATGSNLVELNPPTRLFERTADVVALSIEPEITRSSREIERFQQDLSRLVAAIKEQLAAHVIVFNCFAFDPNDSVRNYFGVPDTPVLRATKLNTALIDASIETGISIIDVDRIVAELGGGAHATGAFRYSPQAYELIRDEFFRVLQDIGFFERRPLVMQVGRKRA